LLNFSVRRKAIERARDLAMRKNAVDNFRKAMNPPPGERRDQPFVKDERISAAAKRKSAACPAAGPLRCRRSRFGAILAHKALGGWLARRLISRSGQGEDKMRGLLALISSFLLLTATASAQDAAYPNRAIKIVVSVPAGGGVDTVTRMVAEGLRKKLGQPVVVENHAGAGGNIGADFVFKSDPDGYTLLASQPSPITVNPLLYKQMPYDPTKFEPVAIMTKIANVLLVRPDFPAKDAKEFIAYCKANPGKVNYASQGIGTTSHLTAALFEKVTGTKLVHVPYKGTAPALNDIIASHVDMIFMELASAIRLHQAGKARILAVATKERIASLKDIPTFAEVGVKDFESATWNAISAPPKTPTAIVAKLNTAINEVLKEPELQDHFATLTLQAASGGPAEAKAFIAQETQIWGEVIKEAHVPAH
jgi:tripartite-type tricarboxylate transporter receptor subunit TctC